MRLLKQTGIILAGIAVWLLIVVVGEMVSFSLIYQLSLGALSSEISQDVSFFLSVIAPITGGAIVGYATRKNRFFLGFMTGAIIASINFVGYFFIITHGHLFEDPFMWIFSTHSYAHGYVVDKAATSLGIVVLYVGGCLIGQYIRKKFFNDFNLDKI